MTTPTSRPVIYGTQGVISSGHYLTSMGWDAHAALGWQRFRCHRRRWFLPPPVTEPIASYSPRGRRCFHAVSRR